MQTVLIDYESFYGLAERPFSLTPEPRCHFRSRSHLRAAELLAFGQRRRDGIAWLTGDAGTGKTILARTLVDRSGHHGPMAYVPHPLLTPDDLLRVLLQEFGAASARDAWGGALAASSRQALRDRLAERLRDSSAGDHVAVAMIDEAHSLPPEIAAELLALDDLESSGRRALQLVLVGAAPGGVLSPAHHELEQRVTTRARLLPLERAECDVYIDHRLTVAGGGQQELFTPRAVDTLHDLSGGVPRLVNLLCARALHEGAVIGTPRIEPPMIERAAVALELTRAQPRRFRWFGG